MSPRRHYAEAGEPIVPEQSCIVCRPSVPTPESTRNLVAVVFRSVWFAWAVVAALAPQFAPASFALSALPVIMPGIEETIS